MPEIQGREYASFVMPEVFYQASKFLLLLLVFQYFWTPDRSIQGQAKSGLKIAGVTNKGNRSVQGDIPFLSFPKSFIGNPRFFFGFSIGNHRGFPSYYLDPS